MTYEQEEEKLLVDILRKIRDKHINEIKRTLFGKLKCKVDDINISFKRNEYKIGIEIHYTYTITITDTFTNYYKHTLRNEETDSYEIIKDIFFILKEHKRNIIQYVRLVNLKKVLHIK